MKQATYTPFQMERLGTIMEGDASNPDEVLGVLNPACCRDRDGGLLLFPRVVAAQNYSRIGIAHVRFDADGTPTGVDRLGYALEPTEGYERNARTAGVEDARITYIDAIDLYVMAYVGYGPLGPRVALATSEDAYTWRRLGLAKFTYAAEYHTDFDLYVNKDAYLFPEPVHDPHGRPALAMIHRPDYNVNWWSTGGFPVQPSGIEETRPSIWISYAPLDAVKADPRNLCFWRDHQLLATPLYPWESLKIGGGAPPVLTPLGWVTIIHGVDGEILQGVDHQPRVRYAAGVLVLDRDDPRKVLYRSREPILAPDTAEEQHGVVDNVVFPTAVDPRPDGRIDVFYGMADARIGVARMLVPSTLPSE
ncbi:MAG: GH130 [uncultured Chloroflexia bacterium]|uniref:GH130 n=1 Tax=uncultured Chloroflexia bacterium TaxID=1672391 RepID=A0A6J4H1T9_9CHLR|nr:MAG: GH130 [uncultured Chloroflexia bacterium]